MDISQPALDEPTADLKQRWLARTALVLAAALLVHGLVVYLLSAAQAITFPHQIDYGEGIVWQQLRLILSTGGYGSINDWPAIVFHYPPLYHALSAALAAAIDWDQLAAGRLLSVAATLVTALLSAIIVRRLCSADADKLACWVCGLLTGLIVFSLYPVVAWSMLMRVDSLALAFSFAGVYFGIRALTVPKAVHIAALCFVMAVYSKQTAIAAPAAVFGTLLFLRPRIAFAGILTTIASGLAVLAALSWLTDGGFLRHILLYNINRFDPERLLWIATVAGGHVLYLAVAAFGIITASACL
jgi:hypothetical protein